MNKTKLFFTTFKFHLIKNVLSLQTLILLFCFIVFTICVITGTMIASLSKPSIAIISYILTCTFTIFFISILNSILIYNLYISTKFSGIIDIEKRSHVSFFQIFTTRFMALKLTTIMYNLLIMLFWSIILISIRPANYYTLMHYYTPGMFAFIVYDFLFSGIVLIFASNLLKLATLFVPIVFAAGISLFPITAALDDVFGTNELSINKYPEISTALSYKNDKQTHYIFNQLKTSLDDINNKMPLNINTNIQLDVGNYAQQLINSLKDGYSTSLWYKTGTFDNFISLTNNAIEKLDTSIKESLFYELDDLQNPNSSMQSNFAYQFYEIVKQELVTKSFILGKYNDSFLNSSSYSQNEARGQLQQTLSFLQQKDIWKDIYENLKIGFPTLFTEENYEQNYQEWLQFIDNVKKLSINYFFDYKSMAQIQYIEYYANSDLLGDDYYGLNLFFTILYTSIEDFNTRIYQDDLFSETLNGYGDSKGALIFDRLMLPNILFNMFTYTGCSDLASCSAVSINNSSIFQYEYSIIDAQYITEEDGTNLNVTQIKEKNYVWVGEWYIEISLVAIIFIGISYFTYNKKITS